MTRSYQTSRSFSTHVRSTRQLQSEDRFDVETLSYAHLHLEIMRFHTCAPVVSAWMEGTTRLLSVFWFVNYHCEIRKRHTTSTTHYQANEPAPHQNLLSFKRGQSQYHENRPSIGASACPSVKYWRWSGSPNPNPEGCLAAV